MEITKKIYEYYLKIVILYLTEITICFHQKNKSDAA
jgi:hypothetical protein